VGVEEVQAGRGAPVSEQARLDVLRAERLAQERVGEQVDLADRQVVRGPPPGVDPGELDVGRFGRLPSGDQQALVKMPETTAVKKRICLKIFIIALCF